MAKVNGIDFVRIDILENWRFWNGYAQRGDFEGAGKEVVAQANAMLAQDTETNERAARLINESLEFKRKKSEAGKIGGKASAAARCGGRNDKRKTPRHGISAAAANPPTPEQVYDFAAEKDLDPTFAREWYEMTVVDRDFKDRDGNAIKNWKAAVAGYCNSKSDKLNF